MAGGGVRIFRGGTWGAPYGRAPSALGLAEGVARGVAVCEGSTGTPRGRDTLRLHRQAGNGRLITKLLNLELLKLGH